MCAKHKLGDFAAELHTPEELLAGAESLLMSDDPQLMRAAVLEAISSLESYVYKTVFGILQTKLDALLVKWLEDKTRMDFDSRLYELTSIATGKKIDKKDSLWESYKQAKTIRNQVTHSGQKVSKEQAKSVIRTVYDWLSFLGSTAEVDLALLGLKKYIEREKVSITKEDDCLKIISKYFSETEAAITDFQRTINIGRHRLYIDAALKFGEQTVLVETRIVSPKLTSKSALNEIAEIMYGYLNATNTSRGAIILFSKEKLPESFRTIQRLRQGRISVIGIKTKKD
jgi:hypothetical protein